MKIFCFMTFLLMTLVSSSNRLITITAYEYENELYYNINGAQMPILTLKRNEIYTLNVDTPSLSFCIQTPEGDDFNLGDTGNCIEGTLDWQVPLDAPDSLVYVCKELPQMKNTINIVDSAPYLHAWFNGNIIQPGGTIKYTPPSPSVDYLTIDLTNNGDDDLIFLHHPILKKSSMDDGEALVGLLEPNHRVSPMGTTSAKISSTGPFLGYIVFVTNDIQINYHINLMISTPSGVFLDSAEDAGKNPELSIFDTGETIPKAVNANELVLYVVAPVMSVVVVCLSIGVMVLMLLRKEVELSDDGEIREYGKKNVKGMDLKRKDSESDLDVIQITEEELSSEVESVGEEMYTPEEDKFFRRNL